MPCTHSGVKFIETSLTVNGFETLAYCPICKEQILIPGTLPFDAALETLNKFQNKRKTMPTQYKCSVDIGCICFIPLELAEEWDYGKSKKDDLTLVHMIKAQGSYNYTLKILNTWLGDLEHKGTIKTKKGFLLGDLCYVLHAKMAEILDQTNDLQNFPAGICINTGGDGVFNVDLQLTSEQEGI